MAVPSEAIVVVELLNFNLTAIKVGGSMALHSEEIYSLKTICRLLNLWNIFWMKQKVDIITIYCNYSPDIAAVEFEKVSTMFKCPITT